MRIGRGWRLAKGNLADFAQKRKLSEISPDTKRPASLIQFIFGFARSAINLLPKITGKASASAVLLARMHAQIRISVPAGIIRIGIKRDIKTLAKKPMSSNA